MYLFFIKFFYFIILSKTFNNDIFIFFVKFLFFKLNKKS